MRATVPYFKNVHSPFVLFNRLGDDFSDLYKELKQEIETSPAHQLKETEKAFFLNVDLPGVKAADINISAEKGLLKITAERKVAFGDGFSEQKYSRSFSLPDNVDADAFEAHYEDGVLFLALPKSIQAQPKKISVSTGQKPSSWQNWIDGQTE